MLQFEMTAPQEVENPLLSWTSWPGKIEEESVKHLSEFFLQYTSGWGCSANSDIGC